MDHSQLCCWDIEIPAHKQNSQFMFCIFDEVKPLKTIFLDPLMVVDIDYSYHRSGNTKHCLNLQNICKDELCSIYAQNYYCPILLTFLSFKMFSWYIISRKTTRSNTENMKRCGDQLV